MAEDPNGLPDLSALIAEENRDKSRENAEMRRRESKERRKKMLLIIPACLVAAGLAVTLFIFNPFPSGDDEPKGNDQASAQPSGDKGTKKPVSNGKQSWWEKDGNKFPVDVPKWSEKAAPTNKSDAGKKGDSDGKVPSGETSEEQLEAQLNERFNRSEELDKLYGQVELTYEGASLGNTAVQLPSREGGYTDDVSQQKDKDGNENPLFSFWTREGFSSEVGVLLNRLLNPVFGDWQGASEGGANGDAKEKLSDLFTSEWLDTHGPSDLPIVTSANAPIKGVDYLPSGGTRWVGTVDPESESWNFQYNRDLKGYEVDYSATVTYSAWTTDKKVSSFKGKLSLHMIPNSSGQNSNSGNRIVIDEASLSL